MGKYVISLLAVLSLVAAPGAVAQARTAAHGADLYPIPSASSPTPAAAVSSAAVYLATLSPAALAATGGPKLSAETPGAGAFAFLLSARVHGRTVVIGTGSASAPAAGTVTVKIRLTKAGKAALKGAKGRLRVTVAASFKPEHGKAETARRVVTLK